MCFLRPGVVGSVTVFQPDGPAWIPGGIRSFKFYSGTGCVSFVCIVAGDDTDVL